MIAEPLVLPNGVRLRNRLIKSAMSEALADDANSPTPSLIDLFGRWSAGGAAVLITGNTPVDRRHLEHAGNFVLDRQTDMDAAKALARAGKSGGAKMLAQLSHAGRQTPAAINPHPLSISDQPLELPGYGVPVAAGEGDFASVVDLFVNAALLAQEAGFDGVEVHAAHGYLLSSALSPRINTRTDQWGGPLENRARLVLEVVRAVRSAVARRFIVAVKLNSSDFQKGGFAPEEAVEVAGMLQAEGVDFIEISGGTFEAPTAYQHTATSASTQAREGYFLTYAAAIKAALDIPLMVTGGFRSRSVMNAAVEAAQLDLIGIGRPLIMDPECPAKLLEGRIEAAPSVERYFPPASELPRGAVLNWFCTQLAVLGKNGAADAALPLLDGHQRYLDRIDVMTAAHKAARLEGSAAG